VSAIIPQKKGDATVGFQIVKLKSRIEPHKINPKQDYQRLQQVTTDVKKQDVLQKWIAKYKPLTYIKYTEAYENCVR
jgi:peptidyl-prolyl cis-trans isomerase SurA